MTDAELKAIRERCEAATPGPWIIDPAEGVRFAWVVRDEDDIDDLGLADGICILPDEARGGTDNASNNGIFLAHARTDIPALLAEVERLKAENARLEEWGLDWMEAEYRHGDIGGGS